VSRDPKLKLGENERVSHCLFTRVVSQLRPINLSPQILDQ